jgi:hypothetical protein
MKTLRSPEWTRRTTYTPTWVGVLVAAWVSAIGGFMIGQAFVPSVYVPPCAAPNTTWVAYK